MMNTTLGKIHFWFTFVPFYLVFLGMHFIGLGGTPRRYYSFAHYAFTQRFQPLQVHITYIAFVLGAGQLLFLVNFFWSLFRGRKVGGNPWNAASLEWTAPSPPPHGNWGPQQPSVYRWPYEYSAPGESQDFTPQTVPPQVVPVTK